MQKLHLLDDSVLPPTGVLRRSEIETISLSNRILRDAGIWLEESRVAHQQEIERTMETARRQAYEEGLSAFLKGRDAYLGAANELEQTLTTLLKTSLLKVFGTLPESDIIEATIAPILKDAQQESDLSVTAHPDQVEAIRAVIQKLEFPTDQFAVLGDPDLDVSDCIIYTDSSVINVSIRVVVNQLVEALSDIVSQRGIQPAGHQDE